MAETSYVDYSQLKKKILEMWVPSAGMQTITDLVRHNWRYMLTYIFNLDNIPRVVKDTIEKAFETAPWGAKIFRQKCDNLFDKKPPFQLGEARIAGSFNEGLFPLFHGTARYGHNVCLKKYQIFAEGPEKRQLVDEGKYPFCFSIYYR